MNIELSTQTRRTQNVLTNTMVDQCTKLSGLSRFPPQQNPAMVEDASFSSEVCKCGSPDT